MNAKRLHLTTLRIQSFVTQPLEDEEKNNIKGGFTYTCINGCEFTKEYDCTKLTCYVC